MDRDNDNSVNFEDYVQYLSIIINGTEKDKARLSFKFLDNDNKGTLSY